MTWHRDTSIINIAPFINSEGDELFILRAKAGAFEFTPSTREVGTSFSLCEKASPLKDDCLFKFVKFNACSFNRSPEQSTNCREISPHRSFNKSFCEKATRHCRVDRALRWKRDVVHLLNATITNELGNAMRERKKFMRHSNVHAFILIVRS